MASGNNRETCHVLPRKFCHFSRYYLQFIHIYMHWTGKKKAAIGGKKKPGKWTLLRSLVLVFSSRTEENFGFTRLHVTEPTNSTRYSRRSLWLTLFLWWWFHLDSDSEWKKNHSYRLFIPVGNAFTHAPCPVPVEIALFVKKRYNLNVWPVFKRIPMNYSGLILFAVLSPRRST